MAMTKSENESLDIGIRACSSKKVVHLGIAKLSFEHSVRGNSFSLDT